MGRGSEKAFGGIGIHAEGNSGESVPSYNCDRKKSLSLQIVIGTAAPSMAFLIINQPNPLRSFVLKLAWKCKPVGIHTKAVEVRKPCA